MASASRSAEAIGTYRQRPGTRGKRKRVMPGASVFLEPESIQPTREH